MSETHTHYADVLRMETAQLSELHTILESTYGDAAPYLKLDTPFLRAGRAFVGAIGRMAEEVGRRAEDSANERPATAAELQSCREGAHSMCTRFAGILLRALDAEVHAGVAAQPVRAAHEQLAEVFDRWCDEAKSQTPAEPLPIRTLVATQLGSVLASALYLNDRHA